MALDGRTVREQLTPEARRELLRAFADRMLLKITAMDDPEDMPGVERCVRTAAMIERVYSLCDRAEVRAPDPRKLEAERANNEGEAIKARVHLAGTLQWGETRRRALGPWWDAAREITEVARESVTVQAPAQNSFQETPATPVAPEIPVEPASEASDTVTDTPDEGYVDDTASIEAARAELALRKRPAAQAKPANPAPPP